LRLAAILARETPGASVPVTTTGPLALLALALRASLRR
jgi:hypothetical protein